MTTLEHLRRNLNESFAALNQARRNEDLAAGELFARTVAYDFKMLRLELEQQEKEARINRIKGVADKHDSLTYHQPQ